MATALVGCRLVVGVDLGKAEGEWVEGDLVQLDSARVPEVALAELQRR